MQLAEIFCKSFRCYRFKHVALAFERISSFLVPGALTWLIILFSFMLRNNVQQSCNQETAENNIMQLMFLNIMQYWLPIVIQLN